MATVRAVSKAAPPPKKDVNPAELGVLADNANTAELAAKSAVTTLQKAKAELAAAPAAKKPALQRGVDLAQARVDSTFDTSFAAGTALERAMHAVAGGKLANMLPRLSAMYEQTVTARDAAKPGSKAWKQLDAAVQTLATRVTKREEEHLMKAKWVGVTEAEMNMDGLEDLASRSRDEQIRLAGAPVIGISTEKAVEFDRRKVSIVVKSVYPGGAAKMLKMQLEGADEATQLKLIKALSNPSRDHLGYLINKSGTDRQVANELTQAISTAKGQAKTELLALIAKGIDGPKHAMISDLGGSARFGNDLEVNAALLKELQRTGKTTAADALMQQTASGLSELRGEFEAAKKKVDAHNAEFGRTVTGFATAADPKKLEDYRDRFVSMHKADFDALDKASQKYLQAFKIAQSNVFPTKSVPNPLTAEGKLSVELKAAGETHAAALLGSGPGQKELDKAMELQMLKQPSWLDSLSSSTSKVKDRIELPAKAADFAARAMMRVAVARGNDWKALSSLVQKNATLLGITPSKATEFAAKLAEINNPSLDQATRLQLLKKNTADLGGGEYGPAEGKGVKALGLLLAAPSLINGWINISDKSAFEVVSHSVDTLGFGNELVSLFTDTKVLGKVLGAAGVGISLIKGIGALAEGNLLEGGTSVASAVGGALMLVPGGQLFGAALIIGSAIASQLWGDDPAQDSEDKQEAAVKDFLQSVGVRPEIAEELKDVLQTNHRSMGPFIEQMAGYLKMKPSAFLTFLDGRKPAEVRALVKMVKNMPANDKWQFTEKRGDPKYETTEHGYVGDARAGMMYTGPRSLETAKLWMIEHRMLPPG